MRKHVEICRSLLDRCNNEGKEFLSRIVTGHQTWARIQRPEYGVGTPGIANEDEIQDSVFRGKGDANRFWDSKGPILEDYLEKGVLLFVPPWCTLLVEWPCLHCHSSKETDAIKVKLRSHDHSSTNSKHACAEGSVTNLKLCYGESADNFLLPYVIP
jgi:hypothetical protein